MGRWWNIIVGFVLSIPLVSALEMNFFKNIDLKGIFKWGYNFMDDLLADPETRTIVLAIIILIILYNVIVTALTKTPLNGPHSKKIAFALSFLSTISLFFGEKSRDFMFQYSYVFLWLLLGVFFFRIVTGVLGKFGVGQGGGYGGRYTSRPRSSPYGNQRNSIINREGNTTRQQQHTERDDLNNEEDEEDTIQDEIKKTKKAIKVLEKVREDLVWLIDALKKIMRDRRYTPEEATKIGKKRQDIKEKLKKVHKYLIKEQIELFKTEKEELTKEYKFAEIEAAEIERLLKYVREDEKVEQREESSGEIPDEELEKLTETEKGLLTKDEHLNNVKKGKEQIKRRLWELAVRKFHGFIIVLGKLMNSMPSLELKPKSAIEQYEFMLEMIGHLIPYLEDFQKLEKRRDRLDSHIVKLVKKERKINKKVKKTEKKEGREERDHEEAEENLNR